MQNITLLLLRYRDLKKIHGALKQLEKSYVLEEALCKETIEKETIEAEVTLIFIKLSVSKNHF